MDLSPFGVISGLPKLVEFIQWVQFKEDEKMDWT